MSTDVRSATASQIRGVSSITDHQCVDSVIHITLERGEPPTLRVNPETVEAYYTHHGGGGDEMKPHRLLWIATFGRQPGETILIRVRRVMHPAGVSLEDPSIQDAFRGNTPQSLPLTLLIEHHQNSVETGPIALPTDRGGRINFKYDVELMHFDTADLITFKSGKGELPERARRIAFLDPGGNLIPDP